MTALPPGLDLPDLAHRAPLWLLQWSIIMITSSVCLISTPKSSVLRLAWIPCCLFLVHNLLKDLFSCSASFAVRNVLGGMFIVEVQHLLSILIFIWPDSGELERGHVYEPDNGYAVKIVRTVGFFYNLRGIGTAWQIKRLNEHPEFLTSSGSDGGEFSRGQFILRQLAVIAWQWLLLDLIYEGAIQQPPEERMINMGTDLEFVYRGLTTEQWVHRFIVGFVSWQGPTRVFLDLTFRITSVLCVASGMSHAESWRPSFGTVADLYSLRSFWGNTWHQYLRRPLTTISNFTTRRVLRLPTPSLFERYLNITLVFLLSGIAHALAAWYDPTYPSSSYLPTIAFFLAAAVGIMLEDSVQAIWRWVSRSPARKDRELVPTWHRAVGFVWLATWFTLTAPWMVYSPARFDSKYSWFVPVRIVPALGAPMAATLVGLGAASLILGLGARI